jgi:YidC/Oxa1 family membrane protein insertase
MEKRLFLALLLTGIVLVVTPMLFPTRPVPSARPTTVGSDSGLLAQRPSPAAAPVGAPAIRSAGRRAEEELAAADTVRVDAPDARLEFSTRGAAPVMVRMPKFRSFAPSRRGEEAVLEDAGEPLLRYRVLVGGDTVDLGRASFSARAAGATVRFESVGDIPATVVEYQQDSGYLSTVRFTTDVPGRAFLLVDLPGGFVSQEADTLDDIRHLAFAAKPVARGAQAVTFASLDPGERKLIAGPLSWAVSKSKYFVVGILSPSDSVPFAELQVTGGRRDSKLATRATGTVVVPLTNGGARFDLYAGPQAWERMRSLGREFETANPYGGFMQPVVQPFATIVMRLMLWLKQVVRLDYGWVLVIFGLAIRILLWPLNQSAMRASIRLQRIQPELMAVQERYKNDRTKQQQELMRVYQEHGMSPFSALSGCLPALIPMPVFFALFFVFQNTIEFRGVPFLWLSDISLRDPLYILPVLTGASMFLLSWIGMRNMPKNPQATMMLYLMPGMFTLFLLSTASGLSIYYLVQQIAAIPQQWMIANERRKAQPKG